MAEQSPQHFYLKDTNDDETDPDKTAHTSTKFLFQAAEKEAEIINDDVDFKNSTDDQKNLFKNSPVQIFVEKPLEQLKQEIFLKKN